MVSVSEQATAMPVRTVAVEDLLLDPNNPRLPESLTGATQAELLIHLEHTAVLSELAASFVANGYFPNEPIVTLPPDPTTGQRVVVEGNRRTAALKILLGEPVAVEADLAFVLDPSPGEPALDALRSIPAVETASPGDLRAYLGYRHISGLRTWGAEAKARFISKAVDDAASGDKSPNPFYDVGRLLGSNARGVRTAYVAYQLLKLARDEADAEVRSVVSERFGVWTRLLSTANVSRYLGLPPDMRTYVEVTEGLRAIRLDRLKQVVGHLTPGVDNRAVLSDSRDVTRYSDVLGDESARQVLERYGDLDLAHQTLAGIGVKRRIEGLAKSCELLKRESRSLAIDEDVVDAAVELADVADELRTLLLRRLDRARGEK